MAKSSKKKTKPAPKAPPTKKPVPLKLAKAPNILKGGPSKAGKSVKLSKSSKAPPRPVIKKSATKKPPAKPLPSAPAKKIAAKVPPQKATLPAKLAAVKKPIIKPVATKAAKPVKPITKIAAKSSRPAPVVMKPEPFQPQPAVATNLKPRKSQIGLGVRELEHFADMLLAKRRELVGDMSSMEREALRTGGSSNLSTLPVHMADMGTDNYEQEFTLGLVEKDRNLLREINHALAKIQNGTYGICEGTGHAISKARLEVQPWARYSIEYARQKEKNGMGVRTIG